MIVKYLFFSRLLYYQEGTQTIMLHNLKFYMVK